MEFKTICFIQNKKVFGCDLLARDVCSNSFLFFQDEDDLKSEKKGLFLKKSVGDTEVKNIWNLGLKVAHRFFQKCKLLVPTGTVSTPTVNLVLL